MTATPFTAPNSDWALDLSHVDKVYDRAFGKKGVHALRGITMRVHRGEIFGLLGPNGAGKSTLVKILMTIIRPTRCDGHMLGARVGDKNVLGRVGYLPEHHRFPDYLTGSQVLDFYGALSNVPGDARKARAGELLELVGMSAWADKKVKGYSKGMRQRLGIANALIGNPELIVLDEPTDGVDPVGRRDIREILIRLRMVCDRVAILVQGVVSAQGTMDDLTRESRRYEIETLPAPGMPADIVRAAAERAGAVEWAPSATGWTARLASGEDLRLTGNSLIAMTDEAERVQPFLDALRSRGVTIRAVRPVKASLEDLFMQAVTDPNTGQAYAPGASSDEPARNGQNGGRA
jgi:ABC-2 type transport system ATP-binding protein